MVFAGDVPEEEADRTDVLYGCRPGHNAPGDLPCNQAFTLTRDDSSAVAGNFSGNVHFLEAAFPNPVA